MRITPQANRPGAPAPAQAREPAPATGGIVPSSVSSLEEPEQPQTRPALRSGGGGSGGFTVQLAAEGSEEAARAKFSRMRSQHSSVLSGASPTIRSAEVNGRSVFRVRVGDMSREEAVSMCERLKANGGSCFVARN